MSQEVTGGLESLEAQAEKILSDARNRANEILRRANEEASRIAAARLSPEDVKAECDGIIRKATEEANRQVENSRQEAAKIKAAARAHIEVVARRIVNMVAGV